MLPKPVNVLFSQEQTGSLDIVFVEQPPATVFSVIIYAEFKVDLLQDVVILILLMTSLPPASSNH